MISPWFKRWYYPGKRWYHPGIRDYITLLRNDITLVRDDMTLVRDDITLLWFCFSHRIKLSSFLLMSGDIIFSTCDVSGMTLPSGFAFG